MNNEKNKYVYNGRYKYWENGHVGIKDNDDKVVVPASLGYSDINDKGTIASIVRKNGKFALADMLGNQLCPFIYNEITYIGEECFKAGIKTDDEDYPTVVAYKDTSMVFEILDAKGNVLCPKEKGYNYISELDRGEVTAAIDGKCGVIDKEGNVLIDLQYTYIEPLGEQLYLVTVTKSLDRYATVMDDNGNVVIPSNLKYQTINHFHQGVAVAYQNDKWGIIDHHGNKIGSFNYTYAKENGEGFILVEMGTKKNLMRPDGTLVLNDWYHEIYKVNNGVFVFGNTIRKSKTNPKTRYIRGVAHVSGDIIFPMIFESVHWRDVGDFMYAEIGTKPYILTPNGGIHDPQLSHLPPKEEGGNTDNFPWKGTNGSICEKCIFASTIIGNGEGCKQLNKETFREHYIKGKCNHQKTSIDKESLFEYGERKQREEEEKKTDVFALRMLKEFITERLDGDIRKLRDYDFTLLCHDDKYGNNSLLRMPIITAIMSLAFSDVWIGLSMDSLEHAIYKFTPMNDTQELFGSNMLDQYFMGMNKFHPSALQHNRAVGVAHLMSSLGNIWVLPNKDGIDYHKYEYKYRRYMDKFLQAIYNVFTQQKPYDKSLMGAFYQNRKLMPEYQGEDAFRRFIQDMMLEDYVDDEGRPKELFMFVWSSMKDLERDTYFQAIDQFCSFCENAIPKRADRIIEKLIEKLN